MKKLKNIIAVILIILLGIPLLILAIPFFIVLSPFAYFRDKKFKKEFAAFIKENEGRNFFCYNNRKNAQQFIENEILPNLNKGVEIVFLNGRKIESEYESRFISSALYKLKKYNKFPHLMKIRNGELVDISINNQFYGVLNMNKSKSKLLDKINQFFELNQEKT